MGSITHITDRIEILNTYQYDAWGEVVSEREEVGNRFKFNGQQLDSITGQYYLRARYYNPVIGRFTQEDTYRGDGLNLYAYCRNNPVYYVDPTGHDSSKVNSYQDARDGVVDEGEGNTSKAVWDNIKITQSMYDGTKIPKSFELTARGQKFWVHPNGTKHMLEYITRDTISHGMPMNSQILLSSFQSSVSDAVKQGVKYDEIMNIGEWELIFSKPRGDGLLPVIKHAVYRPQ